MSIDRSYWVGNEAAAALGQPASAYPFTDEEKLLRERAYALIRPPYSWPQWVFILAEFRRNSVVPYYGVIYDYRAYAANLLGGAYRSATARYAELIDDIRNDLFGIDQFVPVAYRVVDLDRKREKSLAYVSNLTGDEAANATARVAENAMILGWVQHCLRERAASYRYVLERLVIGVPSAKAVEAERTLVELDARIAKMYPGLAIAPGDSAGLGR